MPDDMLDSFFDLRHMVAFAAIVGIVVFLGFCLYMHLKSRRRSGRGVTSRHRRRR
jgi:hypothetical protein